MKNFLLRISGVVASLALLVTTANINVTCVATMHQPELPEEAKKLRKF